jgi:formate C-acetyltransferase
MALHDRDILRTLACGIADLSHAADSLSAIKYAGCSRCATARDHRRLRDRRGVPCFGNNDDARTIWPSCWCR